MQILYSGRVQGVGFRYTAKSVASGFEVVGTVQQVSWNDHKNEFRGFEIV